MCNAGFTAVLAKALRKNTRRPAQLCGAPCNWAAYLLLPGGNVLLRLVDQVFAYGFFPFFEHGLGDLHEGCVLFRRQAGRSEEHTSELQSLMRISYAVFCLQKKRYTERNRQQERM